MRLAAIFCLGYLALPPALSQVERPALEEEGAEEGEIKSPAEEFRLAKILSDQGKYEAAVKHFKNVLKGFEEEDPQGREEQFYEVVARLHIVAYELKRSLDDQQYTKEQGKLCEDWMEALFPSKPRAAGKMVKGTGQIRTVRNLVEIRKATADKAVSALILDNSRGGITKAAVTQVKKWVQEGHKVLVKDSAATAFGFTVVPLPSVPNPRISRDRKSMDHFLLMGVRPDTLSFPGQNMGWCVTSHISPSAKPLLTITLPPQGGRRLPPVGLCVLVKLGKGEVLFCNGQIDAQSGDGSQFYGNVQSYLQLLPGQEKTGTAAR